MAAVLFFAIGGAALVYAGMSNRTTVAVEDPEQYLRSLDYDVEETDEFQQRLNEPFLTRVLRPIGSRALGTFAQLLPANYLDGIRLKLVYAGLSGRYRPEEIVTAQVLVGAIGFLAALGYSVSFSPSTGVSLVTLVGFPILGAMYPTGRLSSAMKARQEQILKDLPDTLDLLAISVEAGVGFEGALGVVCEHFDSPLADEFSRTLKEMELGLPRRDALQNLKKRTEVPELSNFVLALTQADALGMPIGRVLKTQAAEMRSKRRQWAREKAAKLPVKILFPLILFIFPPVFVIVLGPAAAQIGKSFH
ncbi:MAG TPA: type II secretion system F family protein [Acidimicrobiales bacterium]|nr:type II secretion system F family protein [Acidimicrobiales bacterium]